MTVKNVIDFVVNVLSYVDLFGSSEETFMAEFRKRYQALGRVIQEEVGAAEGQKVEKLTILGPRANSDFAALKTWCQEQGINFNS